MNRPATAPRRAQQNLLLIAARAPVPGQTKTRLGAGIGAERAARLYRAFLIDLARRFTPARAAFEGHDVGWAFTPVGAGFPALIDDLSGSPTSRRAHFVPQEGDGWAIRQDNLFRWARDEGYARTVLIASDSPHLSWAMVNVAFRALNEADVAIGRVDDGGYYLIGLRGHHDVLADVPMGTGDAATALIERARALGLDVAEGPPTFDVDEEADLERLATALAPDGEPAPATWAALRELELIPTRR